MENIGFSGLAAHVAVRLQRQVECLADLACITLFQNGFCLTQQPTVSVDDFLSLGFGVLNHG